METTYYTLYTRENAGSIAQASGGEDRLVLFTQRPVPKKHSRREDNVISFSDYLDACPEVPEDEDEEGRACGAAEQRVRRLRTDHSQDGRLRILELIVCGAIICTAAAACAMFLL